MSYAVHVANLKHRVRFEVLTAASMMLAVFWVVESCSLVEFYRRFITLMMEAASTFEMSVNFYQTTRRNNLEDSYLLEALSFRS
jgi:hypothetical protein